MRLFLGFCFSFFGQKDFCVGKIRLGLRLGLWARVLAFDFVAKLHTHLCKLCLA